MNCWKSSIYAGLAFLWLAAGLERNGLHELAVASGITAAVYGIVSALQAIKKGSGIDNN